MNRILIISGLMLFLITACEDGIQLFETDVTFSRSVAVDIPAGAPKTFTLNEEFDASTDPEVQGIIDEIDNYQVNSVSYSIDNYSGNQTILVEGTFSIKSQQGNIIASHTVTNVDLQALNGQGPQVIGFSQSEIDAVEAALFEDNAVNVILQTEIDNTPVAFDLKISLDTTIEYRVLD